MKTLPVMLLLCIAWASLTAFKTGSRDEVNMAHTAELFFRIAKKEDKCHKIYTQEKVSYLGMRLTAYKSRDGWTGFFRQAALGELPGETASAVSLRYSDYTICNAAMFLSSNGYPAYVAHLTSRKKSLLLIINMEGEVGALSAVPGTNK